MNFERLTDVLTMAAGFALGIGFFAGTLYGVDHVFRPIVLAATAGCGLLVAVAHQFEPKQWVEEREQAVRSKRLPIMSVAQNVVLAVSLSVLALMILGLGLL